MHPGTLKRTVFFTDSRAKKNVTVFDTTLRDGEQTPGISFTREEKLGIAEHLSKIGVHTIEAGFPASSETEREIVTAIKGLGLSAQVCGLARSLRADVDACIDCDVDMVHVFIPTSDVQREYTIKKTREQVLTATGEIIAYVRDHLGQCMFSAMDATRTDWDYLMEVYRVAVDAGATIINVPDTVGVITPTAMKDLVTRIGREVDCPIDVHCHNDFGLAVANTIAAVEGGASQVQVTVNGIGERAGNADLAQTVMVLSSVYGIDTGIKTTSLVETSRLVSRYAGMSVPSTQPIVGENAFAHESGIHSHGVIARSDTFEPGIMTPEMVGHRRRLKLGKHAGRHAVRQMLAEVHMAPTDAQIDDIIVRVKEIAGRGKRVTDADLYEIAESVMQLAPDEKTLKLQDVAVMTGNHVIPTASVRATVEGVEHIFSSVGNGPVDAAVKAILGIIPAPVHLKEFNIEAISGGTDALGHVTITVEDERGRVFDASASSDDIILASVEAVINAINLVCRTRKNDRKPEE
ncbi:2-isopropylmalate synthase [Methanoculleus sp. 7T]|uniref:2-isopropylmalate synthase n=1 Tax=Methanoculleus sp. 7T TaxID=2937282 RepID=UPI0020C071A8|nr:2-isopropylmalate synthase [Methanoculleus sp. 7T]MCK8519356.1 2-isopropylmalate synthase [Methanoculleus sp. 7T]